MFLQIVEGVILLIIHVLSHTAVENIIYTSVFGNLYGLSLKLQMM